MIADRLLVSLSVAGLVILAIVTARDMGRDEGRREVTSDLFEKVPSWASSCRLNRDGTKECKAYGAMMKRSKVEWKRNIYFQERLGRVK